MGCLTHGGIEAETLKLDGLQPVVRIKGEGAGLCQKKNIEELLAICAKLDDRAAVR